MSDTKPWWEQIKYVSGDRVIAGEVPPGWHKVKPGLDPAVKNEFLVEKD